MATNFTHFLHGVPAISTAAEITVLKWKRSNAEHYLTPVAERPASPSETNFRKNTRSSLFPLAKSPNQLRSGMIKYQHRAYDRLFRAETLGKTHEYMRNS